MKKFILIISLLLVFLTGCSPRLDPELNVKWAIDTYNDEMKSEFNESVSTLELDPKSATLWIVIMDIVSDYDALYTNRKSDPRIFFRPNVDYLSEKYKSDSNKYAFLSTINTIDSYEGEVLSDDSIDTLKKEILYALDYYIGKNE